MKILRLVFRRLGLHTHPLGDAAGAPAESHSKPYWLLVQAGMPRY